MRTAVGCAEPPERPRPYVTWGTTTTSTANSVQVDWIVVRRVS